MLKMRIKDGPTSESVGTYFNEFGTEIQFPTRHGCEYEMSVCEMVDILSRS